MNVSEKDPWWTDAIIYEVYVDKFAGNFRGLTQKLDYFNYLGVNTLWLLPFYPSPMIDGGYDISDYTGVRSDLGDMSDFVEFIKEAHTKNIRVLADLVLNHTSDAHPWFSQARSSKDNPKRDWYLWSDNDNKYSQAFVHFSDIKKTNWIKNEATDDFYYATFYPQQPDLNWDNQEVYDAMIGVMKFWLAKGVDGFRLDAVSRLVKRDQTNCFALPETHNVLKRIREDISKDYPDSVFLAETGGWPNEAKAFFGEGNECQLVINFPLATNLLAAISDSDLTDVKKVLDESRGICDECRWGVFLTNHDSVDMFFLTNDARKERLGLQGELVDKFGKKGETSFAARLSEICRADKEKILWAFEQLLNLPGVPIIYYGNEIGMGNADLSVKPADTREYVRNKFDWEAVEMQKKDSKSILNKVRKMILSR